MDNSHTVLYLFLICCGTLVNSLILPWFAISLFHIPACQKSNTAISAKISTRITANAAKAIIKHFTKDKHCECGTLISNSSKKCKTCDEILQRKVERPTYEELQTSVKLIGYSATGRKYNVSDNSIRKWIKNYEKK